MPLKLQEIRITSGFMEAMGNEGLLIWQIENIKSLFKERFKVRRLRVIIEDSGSYIRESISNMI